MADRIRKCNTTKEIESALFDSDNWSSSEDEDSTDELDGMDSVGSDTSGEEDSEDEAEYQPLKKREKVNSWKWCNSNNNVKKFDFCGEPGINTRLLRHLHNNANEREFFYAFVKTDFWEAICKETNRFAESFLNGTTTHKCSLTEEWFSTTADEIQAYFALCVLMAQVKKNKIQKYWSPRAVTETPFFGKIMPYRRFLLLSKFLHFTDNANLDESDRLRKISPIIHYVNQKFQYLYNPTQNLAVDESLMKFRGRLGFKQYNPSKRARFGIKFYKICESSSGYCMQFTIYTGKKPEVPTDIPSSEAVVLELMKPYFRLGYTLAVDNWYTSPALFQKLIAEKTNAVGTVRLNRKNMPKDFQKMVLKKGEAKAMYCHGIAAFKWRDKKDIHVLSTYHKDIEFTNTGKISAKTREVIFKPAVIINYNKQMNAVDRQDQQLASFPIMRRYAKGYRKVFFYIMDMVLYNAYVLYKKYNNKKVQFDDFRENLAEKILEEVTLPEYKRRGRPTSGPSPTRFQAAKWAHFANRIKANPVKKNPNNS